MNPTFPRHRASFFRFAGAASIFAIALGTAQAQEAEESASENEIVVTGFRASLDKALDLKRESATLVDAIVAEDIAKFPDQNLAESLQRVPGVAIEREGGEGRRISVRGLGAQFTRVRVNGIETIAAGGDNASRSFDFNIFASELFSSLVVRKSAEARVDEGSLGAVVDLNTGNPLAGKYGLTVAASAQGSYNSNTEKLKPRFAGLISWKSPSGTIGASLSAAYSKTTSLEVGHDTVRWAQAPFDSVDGVPCWSQPNGGGTYVNSAGCDAVALAFHARIPRYVDDRRERERLGITGSLQFEPTDRTRISLDGLYSKFDEFQQFRTAEVLFRGNERAIDVSNYTIDGDNTLVKGTFSDAWVRQEHYQRDQSTEFYQLSGRLEQDLSDSFRFTLLGGLSRSEGDIPRESTIMLDDRDAANFAYDYTNSRAPIIAFGTDATNPANYQISELRDSLTNVVNKFRTVALETEWDINDEFRVSSGAFYRKYTFDRTGADRNTVVCPSRTVPGPDVVLGTITCTPTSVFGPTAVYGYPATDALTELFTLSKHTNAPAGTTTSFVVADMAAAAAFTGLYDIPARPNITGIRGVSEKSYGGFLQFDAKSEIFGLGYALNAGVRFARTDQSSYGINSGQTVTVARSYDDWLPAVNLSLFPHDDVVLRASIADVMTRPDLGNVTPGGTVDGFNYRVSFGNPALEPYRATNFDLGVEWYFRPQSLLSVAWFKKDVSSFPINQTVTGTYASTGLPLNLINPSSPAATNPEGAPWSISTIINGTGATLDGWEVAFQTPLWFLPGKLANFGVIANATFVSSSADYTVSGPATSVAPGTGRLTPVPTTVTAELLGLSRRSYNATLYYEDGGFSARASAAYRSRFLSNTGSNGNILEGTNSSVYVDASISYDLTDNITLSLEGINLTKEHTDVFADGASNRVLKNVAFGRTLTAGIRVGF